MRHNERLSAFRYNRKSLLSRRDFQTHKQATRGRHAAGSQPTRGSDELTASDGRGRDMKAERVALDDGQRNACHIARSQELPNFTRHPN